MAQAIRNHNINHVASGGTTVNVTLPATLASTLIVCWVSGGDHTVTPTQVSDGTTLLTHATGGALNSNAASPNWEGDFYYFLSNPNAGTTTFTATFSGTGGGKTIAAVEVTGFTTAAFDTASFSPSSSASGVAGVGVTTITAGSLTPASTATLIATTLISDAITTNPKTGNEFSDGGDIASSGDAWCFKVNATAAAHQAEWTAASTNDDYQTATVSFIDSGGGGGGDLSVLAGEPITGSSLIEGGLR
jgi:hypothetical protein